MKPMLRVIALVVVVTFAFSMFAGCGGNVSKNETSVAVQTPATNTTAVSTTESKVYAENGLPNDQEVTIKVAFAEQGYGREWYDNCVASFTKKFPNVKFDTQYSPTIAEVIKTKLAAGDDKEMYDLMNYSYNELANLGKAEPLEDLLQREVYDTPGKKVVDVLTPGIFEDLNYYPKDHHLYYVPLITYVFGLFYDQSFFEQNGWNQDPKTWTEFLKLCEDIKAKGIAPMAYAGMYDYEKFAFAPKQFELADANGNKDYVKNYRNFVLPHYASPENLERWNRMYEMGKKGYIDASSVSINHTQSQMLAIQHKAAMVPSGDWVQNEMKDSTPEGFKWGYMAVPFTDNPDQSIYIGGGATGLDFCVYSPREELNKKWAKEFLLWLYNIESQQQFVEKASALSVRNDYMDDASRGEKVKSIQKSVLSYIKNHKVTMINPDIFDINMTHPNVGKANKVFMDNNSLMATGKKEPQTVLNECDTLLKDAVDAYNAENK